MRVPALMLALTTLQVLPSAAVYAVCTQAGFDQALCELSQSRTAPFCGPRALKRQFKGALGRAQRSLRQARRAFARGQNAKVQAALVRADQQLVSVIVAAETVRANNHISPECRTAISDTIGALRQSIAFAAGGGTTTTSLPSGGTTTTSGAPSFAYSPKCFVASAGTRVTFSGSFQFHPLIGGEVVNGTKAPDPSSPITPTTDPSGLLGLTSASFTLATPGTYPFYCDVHALPFGMEGTAFIVP